MAVHKEHTLRSFPSFPEIENFEDDDDYDNNFVISLEDNGDEDEEYYPRTPVYTSAPSTSNNTNENGEISNVPSQTSAESISKVSVSSSASDAYCRDAVTYSQSQATHFRSNVQSELQPGLYISSKESLQCNQQSFNGSLLSYPSHYPISNLETGINHQKLAVATSSTSVNGTTAISKFTAGATDSPQLISGNMPAHFMHLENHNHEPQSMKSNVLQQNLPTSCSKLPKMHLETIHLDKEVGGIWSEAIFLNTTEVSDISFPDFGPSAAQNNGTHFPVPNSSNVPKLSGPYFKTRSPQIITDCSWNVHTGSTVSNVPENFLKMHMVNGNTSCSCVMCYKGKVNVEGFQKSQNEDPYLTKDEKLSISKKSAKRKKLTPSVLDIEKNKAQSQNVNFEMTCPQVSVNNALKTHSVLSYVSKPIASALHTTSQKSMLDGLNTSETTQSDSSPVSGVTSPKIIVLDMGKKYMPANTLSTYKKVATDIAKTLYLQCEPSKIVTNVSTAFSVPPAVPHIISIPRLNSYPTKVFLKPSEVPGQKLQAVSSALELSSGNTLSLPINGQTSSSQTKVSCKETPSANVSPSASLTSPPKSKVIYVSSDQLLLYPHQTRTPVSIISVNKQPQVKASNASHITVIQLPSDNIPNKQLPTDSAFKTCHQNVLNKNSHLNLNKQDNLNSSVNAVDTSKTLRHVLSDAEKVDSGGHKNAILKLKQPFNNFVTYAGHVHTSQVITTAACGTNVSPVSTGSVHMISLLKDSPRARGALSSAPIPFSDFHSVNTKPRYLTPKIQPSPGLGMPQTLLRLVTPVVQEKPAENSDKNNLFRPQSCTINSSPHNAQNSGNGIPKTFHQTLILKPKGTLTYKSPPERDKSVQTGMLSNLNKVSDPHLPQEGLPSTYIEDWVNKATTYVSEQLREIDCIQEPHNFIPPSGGDNEALLPSSQDTPKESVPLNSAKSVNRNYTISEMVGGIETVPPKQVDKSQLQVRSPTHVDFPKPKTLQVLQSDSACIHVSKSSSVNIASIGSIGMHEKLDQSSALNRTGKKLPVSSALHNKSQEIVSAVQHISHSETGQQTCLKSGDTPGLQLCKSLQASPQSSSSILDSSKGIKLKIKLGILRNEKTKHKESTDVAESNVRNVENLPVSESAGGLYLKECVNINADISGCASDKQIHNMDNSDRTETAEEMFQRCEKQAEQEVFKAQMGIGYVSRSLRPTRTTMAFLDKYPYRFGPGKPKKKGLSDKNVCIVSEKSEDSNNCTSKIDHLTETSGINKQHTKLQVRHKRQVEEGVDKEVKSKHPKLAIKDYPRLKQDCSITDSKTVYCTNILAGHKVYVKFNTFENMCSERAFLVPFFNIGGSRTQFDVEDMEYINKAVMDFESEERSCARHLLYYSRAGNKAVFLRKETNLQASHINDKSYRQCSFVLEGFRRNAKKQTESSPEHWKVDNTIDIEIDRAEIDNDIETEFDTNLSLDEVADGLRITAESAEERTSLHTLKHSNYNAVETTGLSISASVHSSLPSQDRHLASIKIDAYFSRVNELDLVNTETNLCGVQTESNSVSELRRIAATVPVASEFSDSVVDSDQTLTYANKFQGSLSNLQRESANSRYVQQILHPNICAAVKEEVLIDESDAPNPLGHTFNPAWIKEEKLDDDDESIQQLDSSHPACNISSMNSSPDRDRRSEQVRDEDIFIKNEPVDDYLDPLEETESCPSGDSQMEVPQHVTNLPCNRLTNLSTIPVHQLKPADQTVNFTSEGDIISNTLADTAHVETSTIYSQLNDSHESQDHITEPSITASHTQISRLQPEGDIIPIQMYVGDSRINSLFPPLTSTDADKSACDVDDSASVKLTSITEPSLPESPLPSSSMSYSSEILASSDIDDTFISSESDFSTISQSSMLITEVTSEDEDKAAKQNIVQNKITSLVECLRHRLTQDTSNLPPWIASVNKSATETKVKKRKSIKMNVNKQISVCNTASPHVRGDISSSATEICSASRTMSALSSPVLSSVSYSVHQVTSLLQLPSTTSVVGTPSLPLDILPSTETSGISTVNIPPTLGPKGNSNNNLMLPLPEKVAHLSFIKQASTSNISNTSKSDYVVVAECASRDMTDEKLISEAEDIFEIDSSHAKCEAKTGALSELATDTSWSDFVCTQKNKLSNDHFHSRLLDTNFTACSETLNRNRQSPVDFEIEIGKEDLPETALSLQLILPNEDLDIEALKLSRRKHIREYDPDVPLVSSPDTVTLFQKCDVGMKQLHSVNNLQKDASSLSKLEKCKTKHSKENNSLINTQFGVIDYHTDQLQASAENETRQEGSVTSYLCNKFSFQEKNHIKGPRLLHMPSNRRPSITEASKQKAPMQSTLYTLAQAEPITTEELLKTPSLDEIFGASVRKELMADAENKVDSVAKCASQISVNSNSKTKQRMIHLNTSQANISKKKKQNKKEGGNSRLASDISSMAAAFQPKIVLSAIKPPLPNLISHSVNQTESGSEGIHNMNVCKVVLTKLELSNLDKLSENVFLIRKETAVEEKHVRATSKDSVSVSQVNNSKSTFKRAVKNKRRKIARPGFRRKGDVIDYYAYMLETLQKKAQQLEEETRKKEAQQLEEETRKKEAQQLEEETRKKEAQQLEEETRKKEAQQMEEETRKKEAQQLEEETRKKEAHELAMKVQLESTRCVEMTELEQRTDANERDEIVAKFEAIGTNNKEMEEVKDSSKEMCNIKEVDCVTQPSENIASSLEDPINAVLTNNTDEPIFRSIPECGIVSEKTADNDAVDHVSLTDTVVASKKGHEPCVHSEVVDVSDSDWPYLQKFCDETIFNQGNIDYLQKTNKDICFPSTNESSNCEMKFEKKDIVLSSDVNDRAVLGELNSCEIFSNTGDKSGCIEQCTDEQEIDNVDEDEILLGLKIKAISEFSCDDQETRRLSFPQSPADMHMSSLDDDNILDTNCISEGISSDENNISSAVTIDRENAQSVPISCQLESADPVTDALNSTSNSCTAANQSLPEQCVTVKNEKSQRTIDISPSWERLLGHNSINISNQFSDDTSTSHPETSQNHDVSIVASSNFKLKFKLPKGILSKALQLSRDIKNVLQQPASDDTLLSNSEVLPHKSLDETFKNNTNTHNCRKLTENEDYSEDCSDCVTAQPCENQKAQQMSVAKLKFSSVTWNAIQKAKAEFLQKRTSEKRFNEGSTFEHHSENITNTLGDEQAHGVDLLSSCDNENTSVKHQESSDDNDKELVSDNACCISDQGSNKLSKSFLDGIVCDLGLNEELSSDNANVECKESEMEVIVQADNASVSESVFSVGDLTANSALPGLCLKQRKDGIFSNLDLFQGCDAQTHEQSSELPKDANEQSSNKEVQTDNISKVNVIDIEKLKLKLNPVLLGKLKENTEKSVTTLQHSAPISSALIEKFARTSFHKLQQKLNAPFLGKQSAAELNVRTSQQSEEGTSVAKTMSQYISVESVAPLDSHERSSETDLSSVKPNGHVSDKLDIKMYQSQPVSSSSEMSDLLSVSACKQFSQVNTAKLCTILKNFHKAGSTSNSVAANPEGALVDSSAGNIVGNQGNAGTLGPKLQCSLRKSKQLSSAVNTAQTESDAKRRTRGKRKKCQSVSEKHEPMANADMKRAKIMRQKISTSCVLEIPPEQLGEGHDGIVCKNEPLNSEDKGERSFFDCLSSVPLDAWE